MLNALADSIWDVDDPLKVLGLMPVGHRMTVMGTSAGLVVHSPVAYRDALGRERVSGDRDGKAFGQVCGAAHVVTVVMSEPDFYNAAALGEATFGVGRGRRPAPQ